MSIWLAAQPISDFERPLPQNRTEFTSLYCGRLFFGSRCASKNVHGIESEFKLLLTRSRRAEPGKLITTILRSEFIARSIHLRARRCQKSTYDTQCLCLQSRQFTPQFKPWWLGDLPTISLNVAILASAGSKTTLANLKAIFYEFKPSSDLKSRNSSKGRSTQLAFRDHLGAIFLPENSATEKSTTDECA